MNVEGLERGFSGYRKLVVGEWVLLGGIQRDKHHRKNPDPG
jgi:hypothetical protein